MKKVKKYTFGGYETVDPIKPKIKTTGFDPNSQNALPVNQSSRFSVNNPEIAASSTQVIGGSSPVQSTFDLSKIASTVGEGINFLGNARSTIAQGISTGVDIANGAMGAIQSARLKRQEQERLAKSLQQTPSDENRIINNIPVYTKFGGAPKVEGGDSNPNVEAEDGEILETGDGQYFESDGNRHEQGGETYANIRRVLEDTAGKRKDPLSKALVISKDEATEMTGKMAHRGMSHAKVFQEGVKTMQAEQGKYIKAFAKVDKIKTPDPFTINSAKLNSEFSQKLPTQDSLFNKLFDHQEAIKQEHDQVNQEGELPKAAYGANVKPKITEQLIEEQRLAYLAGQDIGPIKPYAGNRNGKLTPTGKPNKFVPKAEFKDYYNQWKTHLPELDNSKDAYDVQGKMYDYLNQTETGKNEIRRMWGEFGNTEYGKKYGIGKGLDFKNLSTNNVALLRNAYADDLLGARKLNPNMINQDMKTIPENSNKPLKDIYSGKIKPLDTSKVVPLTQTQIDQNFEQEPAFALEDSIKSKFDKPLGWYDLLGPTAGLVDSLNRDPELYNPAKLRSPKYKLQDVRPALAENQSDYNAAKANLTNDSVGNAQMAQLFANKLKANNQAIGQYENANIGIENRQEDVSAETMNKQELLDQNTRQSYYDRVLKARDNQSQAKQDALNQIGDTVAKNKAFNANGNLLMKIAPYFNDKAEYNGRKYTFNNNGATTTGTEKVPNGYTAYKVTNKDGKVTTEYLTDREYQLRTRDKNYTLNRVKTR